MSQKNITLGFSGDKVDEKPASELGKLLQRLASRGYVLPSLERRRFHVYSKAIPK